LGPTVGTHERELREVHFGVHHFVIRGSLVDRLLGGGLYSREDYLVSGRVRKKAIKMVASKVAECLHHGVPALGLPENVAVPKEF